MKDPIKILIGGSPCTKWSIAQSRSGRRETDASGIGWELYLNYLIAKQKFQPDLFLYENNKSAAPAIKAQISETLDVDIMHINSALVSAQNRERFYAFNWQVNQPEDRHIALRDILQSEPAAKEVLYQLQHLSPVREGSATEPLRIGDIDTTAQAHRVYSCDGKARTLIAEAGGQGGKTGLYMIPGTAENPGFTYQVKNGLLLWKGEHPVLLQDGSYIVRKLTPLEAERLQTLPDGYTAIVSNAQRYRGVGNGWTAEVIIHILNGAIKDIPRDTPIQVLSMYDGIGTGRYCLDKMGFTNVEYHAYEIDPFAIKVATHNYPDIIEHGNAFDVRDDSWEIA